MATVGHLKEKRQSAGTDCLVIKLSNALIKQIL